jgi:hypothetical protein
MTRWAMSKNFILRNPTYSNNPTVNLDEFAVNPETGELLGFDGLATYRFDKDFNLFRIIIPDLEAYITLIYQVGSIFFPA